MHRAVAPRGGAGIEIQCFSTFSFSDPVAPRGGAGIEMMWVFQNRKHPRVAPRGGAGIEIFSSTPLPNNTRQSPLAEGRELKYPASRAPCPVRPVAPRGGAGIEIDVQQEAAKPAASPLAEGRELKFAAAPKTHSRAVAPRGGAGIEIDDGEQQQRMVPVAPRGGAGIEIGQRKRHCGGRDMSPLAEGRELKYACVACLRDSSRVAPRGGA